MTKAYLNPPGNKRKKTKIFEKGIGRLNILKISILKLISRMTIILINSSTRILLDIDKFLLTCINTWKTTSPRAAKTIF